MAARIMDSATRTALVDRGQECGMNVVLIVIDTLRADTLGNTTYGHR